MIPRWLGAAVPRGPRSRGSSLPTPAPKRPGGVMSRISLSPRRGFLLIFVLSASIRASLLPFAPLDPAWTIGWENGAVAENLIRTGEYANPYLVPTGPTAHPIPFYTGVLALIYRLFGVTMAAEYARCWLAIVGFSLV